MQDGFWLLLFSKFARLSRIYAPMPLRLGCVGMLFVGITRAVYSQPPELSSQMALPEPSGRFPVGRVNFDWIDESRIDPLSPQVGTKRELTVWIWYPASTNKSSTPSDYIPAYWRAALAKRQPPEANKVWRDPSLVHCHSFDNVEIAKAQSTWPAVLMKPGVGSPALDYTTLCEDLASHGYIVVASDSPYNTYLVVHKDGRAVAVNSAALPRGTNATRILEIWSADNRFLLDRLTALNKHDPDNRFEGRLDMAKVGVMGHSFGGATAAEFCHEDLRCKAGIDLEGQPFGEVINTGINRPFMFLLADHLTIPSAEDQQIVDKIKSIYEHSAPGRQYVTLRDSGHFNFSDKCLLFVGPIPRGSDTIGNIDTRRGLTVAAACVTTFFDVHLKGAEASSIDRLFSKYTELVVGPDNHK